MSAYHQMGHDSWNLIPAENLELFGGIILSPVNDDVEQTRARLAATPNRASLDVVLDPQLYVPRSVRGQLPTWPHFDAGCDTEDLGNSAWWAQRCAALVQVAEQLQVQSICSPTILPRVHDLQYYEWTMNRAEQLADAVGERSISVLLTAVVSMRELATPVASNRIASVLTRSRLERVYLIFYDDLTARQQWTDSEAMTGSMALIQSLEAAGTRVLVGYSGFDMMLWKYAGARDVATGKFFNLRRFGPERWEESQSEGRVVEYWTEPALVAWLRENDVTLLRRRRPELITTDGNPFSQEILAALDSNPRSAWRALSWRQYLWWFSHSEAAFTAQPDLVVDLLRRGDANWAAWEASGLLLFDRANDGSWVRPWLNAISGL